MRAILIAVVLLVLSALLVFVAPHHWRRENSFKECTLAEIYAKFFRDTAPELLSPELISPRIIAFVLLGCAGVVAAFYPALFVLLGRWFLPPVGQTGSFLFIAGGVIATAGAFANFVAMIVSHLNLAVGGSSSSGDESHFLWIIPLYHLLFAVASIAMGTSAAVAVWATRVLGR
jgi:hypothetical protein